MQPDQTTEPASTRDAAYGSIVRNRGTKRFVMGAILVGVLLYAYTVVRAIQLRSVKWPTLAVQTDGLTIVGLRDKARGAWKPKFVAIEAGGSWRIRRPDDFNETDTSDDDAPELADRPNVASISSRANRGAIVPVEEVLRESPVVLTGTHFKAASVEPRSDSFLDRKYFIVHLGLTPEGRSRYWQFSREHEDERLAFILKGHIITCAVMKHMDVSSLSIDPIWMKEDADLLARVVNEGAK